MSSKNRIESTRFLTVEGKDEKVFFEAFLKHLTIADVQVMDVGGKDKFPAAFAGLTAQEGFDEIVCLGIVRDAEQQQAGAPFDSICGILKSNGLPQPSSPGVILPGKPNIGAFIMPDNSRPGMLEDLCLETVASLPQFKCIDSFIDCFQSSMAPSEAAVFNEAKAKTQIYLATRAPIRSSVGHGAQQHHWNFEHICLNPLKLFLQTLFP